MHMDLTLDFLEFQKDRTEHFKWYLCRINSENLQPDDKIELASK